MGRITPLSKRAIECGKPAPENKFFDRPNCTFLGGSSDQPFTAFYTWEKFFSNYGQKMKRFIEFGCDQGNTSVYFCLWCINLEADYYGYDKRSQETYRNTPVKRMIKLGSRMRLGNGYKLADEIKEIIQSPGRSVIFTDCVDKPWEFKTFAPMLKRGDILVIHDWDRAIFDDWVKKELAALEPYKLLFEKDRIKLRTLTRFFLKR